MDKQIILNNRNRDYLWRPQASKKQYYWYLYINMHILYEIITIFDIIYGWRWCWDIKFNSESLSKIA